LKLVSVLTCLCTWCTSRAHQYDELTTVDQGQPKLGALELWEGRRSARDTRKTASQIHRRTSTVGATAALSKSVTTPVENHWRKLTLRGVCMSSMLHCGNGTATPPYCPLQPEGMDGCLQSTMHREVPCARAGAPASKSQIKRKTGCTQHIANILLSALWIGQECSIRGTEGQSRQIDKAKQSQQLSAMSQCQSGNNHPQASQHI
jgi:hypothetical protein